MSFSDLMKKWHRRYVEDEDDKTQFSHSASYHNYFQGYSEKKIMRAGGKGYQIVREYTAHYLAFTEDKGRWIRFKILYAALYLGSAALTLLSLFSGAGINDVDWAALFGVLQMVMLLFMLIPMGNYVTAPMYMRMGQYNISARRLGQFAIPTAAFAAVYLVGGLVWYVVRGIALSGSDIRFLLFQFFGTGAICTLCILENRMKYKRIENKSVRQSGFDENQIW